MKRGKLRQKAKPSTPCADGELGSSDIRGGGFVAASAILLPKVGTRIDGTSSKCGFNYELKLIRIGVVFLDLDDLRNKAASRTAFELNNDVERVADVGRNGAIREFDAALQNTTRES